MAIGFLAGLPIPAPQASTRPEVVLLPRHGNKNRLKTIQNLFPEGL